MFCDDYESWLKECDLEDTAENRGWYECDDEDRASYIKDHPDWWDSF